MDRPIAVVQAIHRRERGEGDWVAVSQRHLAAELGIPRIAVRRALAGLVAGGFLEAQRTFSATGAIGPTAYRIVKDA